MSKMQIERVLIINKNKVTLAI